MRPRDKMTTRATEPSPCGLVVLDKPVGPTSMQAVAAVRRRAGGVKTGHAGTLDPLASGVLVIALGRATKSIERLMATDKRYHTTVDLSIRTVGHDLETEAFDVVADRIPSRDEVEAALDGFRGAFDQAPPARSAVKLGGRRAYELARQGEAMTPPARPVMVHALSLVSFDWPLVEIELACAKGFYVRSLARDLGEALGTGGVCRRIVRSAVGPFTLDESVPLDTLPARIGANDVMPLDVALERLAAAGSV